MENLVRLSPRLLESTLWYDHDACRVFITALLTAKRTKLSQARHQIAVEGSSELEFTVPPGSYGLVNSTASGLARRAGLNQDRGVLALEHLGSPDPESRDREFEGRRLVRIEGGFIILNFTKFCSEAATNAERQANYRERLKARSA